MKIDLHIHMEERPEEYALLAALRVKDFRCDGGVFFEHNAKRPPSWWSRFQENSPVPVFWGCEYSSAQGHILIITPDGTFDFDELFLPMQQIVDMAIKAGGAAIPAHPFSKSHSRQLGDEIYRLKGICAVETINGAMPAHINALAQKAALEMGLPSTGGSDAHNQYLVARAFTIFKNPVKTQQDLINSLTEGVFSAAYAPGCNP